MIKIAHRGNINGPTPEWENNPKHLVIAISQGYDVETDIWYIDGELFLGHDAPEHKIDLKFINSIAEETWFHCKNLDALYYLSLLDKPIKYFWHQEDDFTLTSNGYIWTYPGKEITDRSILVDPNLKHVGPEIEAYAVCTDYPGEC